jgi:hypothetical protein
MMPSVHFPVGRQTPRIAAFLSTITLLALAGCGGTGGTEVSTPPAYDSGGVNVAPTISGTPQAAVSAGVGYSFAPTSADANGDRVTFAIQNRPTWATFDTATGRLTGTPGAAEVGTYSNVVISASDGTASTNLPAFSIRVLAVGVGNGNATLSWAAPTLRSDGTALTNLAGYRVYYGTAANRYSEIVDLDVGMTTYVIDNLAAGTWFFAISAVDAAGAESSLTTPASKTIG